MSGLELNNYVLNLLRKFSSKGRAFLYNAVGVNDVEVYSEASFVIGASGKKYLDFGSFAIFLVGHRHPKIISAITKQLTCLPGSSRSLPNVEFVHACESLVSIAPKGLEKVMLLNSGSEAVEAAAKLSRASTGRPTLIHIEKSYHGKSFGALSLTDSAEFREKFYPLLPNVVKISRHDIESARKTILDLKPAAVFIEPIQGEGGIYEVESAYLSSIRNVCSDVGSLLIFDEIQCGLGRTGTMWASQISGVSPDILLVGKALGGGIIPVSALIATIDSFAPYDLDPILHSSTFGGNPLASVVVSTMVDILLSENVPKTSKIIGHEIQNIINDLVYKYPDLFKNLSGRGLMLGLHCKRSDISGIFIRQCLQHGLLLSPCITTPSVIRVTPPITLCPEEIEFSRDILNHAAIQTLKEL